jgi:hypothetical protein
MADQATIESMAGKFQSWAQSLSDQEQATLAEWIGRFGGEDVIAHRAGWWQEPDAWSAAWSQSWTP